MGYGNESSHDAAAKSRAWLDSAGVAVTGLDTTA
jgi:hypothetical protein